MIFYGSVGEIAPLFARNVNNMVTCALATDAALGAESLESITTTREYGFRAASIRSAPAMTALRLDY